MAEDKVYSDNKINDIRPTSRLDNYDAKTPSQKKALAQMQALAGQLIELAPSFNKEASPLKCGQLFFLSGKPGTGKTHLLEALINDVKERAPGLIERMYLLRENFASHANTGVFDHTFEGRPIILIDDLFSHEEDAAELSIRYELGSVKSLISYTYMARPLVIVTSNFSLADDMMPRILKESDDQKRIKGRYDEISCHSGEFKLTGRDHRKALKQAAEAAQKKGGLFKLALE